MMMNFVQEDYCNNNEEDQDEDHHKEIIRETSGFPFSSSSSSSSSSVLSSKYHQNSWLLGPFDSQSAAGAATNFDNKVELMALSLGNYYSNNNEEEPPSGGGNYNNNTGESSGFTYRSIEKEHMFDKVVTPSDVGKLNRLVIPKQHAERCFPLDSSSNEKGLLLNFEDRNGKAWRFRYSYWNSSQSYVMTKGWSRFVKDKKLEAGDIVSFQRGVGELGKDHLFIDWRRRPGILPDPNSLTQIQQSVRWATRFYSLPQSLSIPRNFEHFQSMNYNNTIHPYYHHHHHHHHHHQQQQILGYGSAAAMPVQYYLRPSSSVQIEQGGQMPMVIDSVPVVPGKSSASKRLRLFGVNMECPSEDDEQLSPGTSGPILATRQAAEYANKGKSSLSFDLDL